jgi:hypothetical protein
MEKITINKAESDIRPMLNLESETGIITISTAQSE